MHSFVKPEQAEVILFWMPDYGLELVMKNMLDEMGVSYVPVVKEVFGGQTSLALSQTMNGLNVAFRVVQLEDGCAVLITSSVPALQTWNAELGTLLSSIKLSPKTLPESVMGSYRTASEYSDSYGSDLGNVSFSSYITLWPNGTYTDESYTSASQPSASALSESSASGVWEVRANSLYLRSSAGVIAGYLYESFTNGLELSSGEGDPLLWVRQ
jgi:hypothetical protein